MKKKFKFEVIPRDFCGLTEDLPPPIALDEDCFNCAVDSFTDTMPCIIKVENDGTFEIETDSGKSDAFIKCTKENCEDCLNRYMNAVLPCLGEIIET